MKIDQEYPKWDEFVTLTSTEVLMPIDTTFAREDWKGFNKALNNPEFQAALEAFDKSELPAHFAIGERAKAKADVVADYQECIKLAGSNGNTKQLKKAYESARQNLNKVAAPIKDWHPPDYIFSTDDTFSSEMCRFFYGVRHDT